MAKHKNAEFKYNYVMRYLDGESPTKLGREINIDWKDPSALIFAWTKQYRNFGMSGLISKTGKAKGKGQGRPKKKEKPKYEEMTKEDLIKILEIKDYFIDEFKKKSRARFVYWAIYKFKLKDRKVSLSFIFRILEVSSSGYYSWMKDKPTTLNYNSRWLKRIEEKYHEFNGIYGAERVMGELMNEGLKLNIKTIKRYMQFLGLKSKIRKVRNVKPKVEDKDTKNIGVNYIMMDFKTNTSRVKVFTDTSEWALRSGIKLYFSAVIDSNKNLLGLDVSLRNDSELVNRNIRRCIKKIGKKFYIQFDNAAFYKNETMRKLIHSHKGIRSFGLPGESQANWPIENFWSILKQEFLREYKIETFEDAKALITKIEFTYNHLRIQKNLNWKTPALARV